MARRSARLARRTLLAAAAALAPVALPAQTVTQSAGTPYTTPALSGFQTLGNDLNGIGVVARFSNGASSPILSFGTWAAGSTA